MLSYYLKLASTSLAKHPVLSLLMILAIALGIGASMTTVTVNYLMSSDPIPHKSDQLYYVQVDNWDPNRAANDDGEPPVQLTWIDATNLMDAKRAKRQAAIASSLAIVQVPNSELKPQMSSIRLAYADFFTMFDVPFLYGSPWTESQDRERAQVVVLSERLNNELFKGENSVGETLIIKGNSFQVIGVIKDWRLMPRFYDVTTGPFQRTEEMFLPFLLKETLEFDSSGNVNCWKSPEGEGFQAFLQSECINFQMWVELPTQTDVDAYMDFLDAYVTEQKALGRFPRPLNNQLSDVMQWMEKREVVAQDAQIMLWLAFLFLLVCLLNMIGLLLTKFSTRLYDAALRRAVGARRRDIFAQYLFETALVGFIGGLLGLLFAFLGLKAIKSLYSNYMGDLMQLDATMTVSAISLAIVSAMLAGCYPAWRCSTVSPTTYLRSQ